MVCLLYLGGNYEFSQNSVYPGQDLNTVLDRTKHTPSVFFWKLNDVVGSNILFCSILRNLFSSLLQQSLCNIWQYLEYYKNKINFCRLLLQNLVQCTIYQYKDNEYTQ